MGGIQQKQDLQDEDYIIDMERLVEGADVLSISEYGYGKRTREEEYRRQFRGGKGIKTINVTEKTGKLSALKVVTGEEDLIIINSEGVIIRIDTDEISRTSRNTQGVTLMRIEEDDYIVSVAKAKKEEEEIPDEVLFPEEEAQTDKENDQAIIMPFAENLEGDAPSHAAEDTSLQRLLERAEAHEDEEDN
jgi:DNA gyrase subunit A